MIRKRFVTIFSISMSCNDKLLGKKTKTRKKKIVIIATLLPQCLYFRICRVYYYRISKYFYDFTQPLT